MPLTLRGLLAAACALALALPAQAEKADRDKPMNAEADAMRHDDLRQVTVFTGNVVITKGTMLIRGARVEVNQTPDGYQRAQAIAAPGQLAYYRSKRDGVDEHIEGEAEQIDYDGRADTVVFTRRAVLRRYVGPQVADETLGALIRYDNTRDVYTVDGAPRANGTPSRVRAQLSPRQNAGSAAPAAPAAPNPPAPALKPSGSLEPELR